MNENLPDIDKLFKSAIEQHDDIPSPGVWDSIDNKLDKSNVVDINKKYIQLKRIAILLLLLLSGVVFYEYNSYRNKRDIVKNNPVQKPRKEANPGKPSSSAGLDSVRNSLSNNSTQLPKDKSPINDNKQVITQNENNRNKSGKDYQHFKKNDSRASEYSGNDLPDNKQVAVKRSTKDYSIKNKSANRKGVMKVKIDNAQPSSIQDQDNANVAIQKDIAPRKYYSNIDLMPLATKDFDKSLREPIKNVVKNDRKNNSKKTRISRLSINPFFSPDFAFYSLMNDQPHGRGDDKHDIKKDEKHQFSYTTGVLADYSLSSHLGIQSGIAFSKTTINSESKNIYAERDNSGNIKYRINGSCGYVYILPKSSGPPAVGDSIKAVSSKNELEYIHVPVAIKYNLSIGKFTFDATTGVAVNFLTKGSINTVVDNGITKEAQVINNVEGLKKSYLDGLIGFGAQFNLNGKLAITFAPTARVAITAINSGAAVKTYSNSLGISAGIQIKL